MKEDFDPYKTLGVSETSGDDDVKRAFRGLAAHCHPDLYPGDPTKEEDYKQLVEAYQMVDTKEKRRQLREKAKASLGQGASGAVTSYLARRLGLKEGDR
ncbi:MAG: hypothetical protein UT86_C0004G0045 [Candidatus Magasanikbacteria bacterium GW2011_GWC2_40_17]|uniref:J domain-containing protein n=1 Tax=Candidatus Magasanikbacteria bacterium GW2011_GWA2_42_32 TaxID=1619039 RepID=A0A0G1A7U3_9BACT|nr:MAG: hypothetical protein UT86_C0004G0045 [Candidatus Magasanikbacteria bacterium GW2011_GWC2_40_17]KKS57105.1 MAG: hypothetical protein UV20_C0003G0045 [Candidatus Magasanikbacteria bacterium GW2011_GWA2_42_32]OGH85372.1 MAG: hypothetical protein A2294_01240 [Candidatus Magasanikbacteria bacterium RIFOXYB2_FULL_38_10]